MMDKKTKYIWIDKGSSFTGLFSRLIPKNYTVKGIEKIYYHAHFKVKNREGKTVTRQLTCSEKDYQLFKKANVRQGDTVQITKKEKPLFYKDGIAMLYLYRPCTYSSYLVKKVN